MKQTNNEICVICLMSILNLVKLPCGHVYCRQCIDDHLKIKSQCPICRRVFCKLIGEDYPLIEDDQSFQMSKRISNRGPKQCKYFKKLYKQDNQQYSNAPLIQHTSFISPVQYTFRTARYDYVVTSSGIKAVNMALKTNLFIAFQSIYLEKHKVCEVMQITDVKRSNDLNEFYSCDLKRISHAKILGKPKQIVLSQEDSQKIFTSIKLEPIIDEIEDAQAEIMQLLLRIEDNLNKLQSELQEPQKSWFNLTFPKLPKQNQNNHWSVDTLNNISRFSISAIESIMSHDWTSLQINYQVDLRKRLEVINTNLTQIISINQEASSTL